MADVAIAAENYRSQTLPGLRAGSGRALGGTAGWWCAVYRSMEQRYINLSINELSIFFVIGRAVSGRIIPVRENFLDF